MDIRIIQAVLDVFDYYGETIRFDKERFENALNDEASDLLDECYLVVLGMSLGIYDVMIFDEMKEKSGYVNYLVLEHGLKEEDALFIVTVFESLIKQVGYYFELGNMSSLLQEAYAKNDYFQLFVIAKAYFEGFGVAQDYEKAFEIYSYLYKMGDDSGAYYLGYMCEYGLGIEANHELAYMYYSSSYDDLCLYKMGLIAMNNYEDYKAIEYLDQSQYEKAYLYKGLIFEKNRDYSSAFLSFYQGAKLFDAACLYKVGMYLYRGLGTDRNEEEAYKYILYGYYCLNGDCAYQLAMFYLEGCIVEKNIKKAISYLKQAALLDSRDACVLLGRFYEMGRYVEKNFHISKRYYQKAVELENRGDEDEGI